jgi:hypothetical protein
MWKKIKGACSSPISMGYVCGNTACVRKTSKLKYGLKMLGTKFEKRLMRIKRIAIYT